jgi:hypothetical protein
MKNPRFRIAPPRSTIVGLLTTALAIGTFVSAQTAEAQEVPSVIRSGTGAATSDIKDAVEAFRTDLGGGSTAAANGAFGGKRREVNWDGVPDQFASPNDFPVDFFNTRSPRGMVLSTPGVSFEVSAKAASGTPPRLGNLNPSYVSGFGAFSEERIFAPVASTKTEVRFFLPGTATAAVVRGFGAVFIDVDNANSSFMEFYDSKNKLIIKAKVPATQGKATQSFVGVTLAGPARISWVRLTSGGTILANGAADSAQQSRDKVAMDDFIYAEPEVEATK